MKNRLMRSRPIVSTRGADSTFRKVTTLPTHGFSSMAQFADRHSTQPSTIMRGLLYGALVIAVVGACVNAKLNVLVDDAGLSEEATKSMCLLKCTFIHSISASVTYRYAYPELIANKSAETLFNYHCGKQYAIYPCLASCFKEFNVNVTDKLPIRNETFTGSLGIIRRSCFTLMDKLDNIKTITDCTKQVYPLVSDPKANMKCRKQCCSNINNNASIYSCSSYSDIENGFIGFTVDDSKEDLCQIGCVIDQAARHSDGMCDSVISDLLYTVREDVHKIYEDLLHREDKHQRLLLNDFTTVPPSTTTTTTTTTTTEAPTTAMTPAGRYDRMNQRYYYKVGGYAKVDDTTYIR